MNPSQTQDARILILDDEEANVTLLGRMLEQAKYTQVETLTDPQLLVARYEAFKPDLLLLDLNMPHLDGFAIMERLATLPSSVGYFPILVLTGDIAPETKQRALAAGAKDFLTKPFERAEVLLRISNLLEARLLHVALRKQNDALEAVVEARTADLEAAFSQLKRAQKGLVQQERLGALGTMASGVAHDFNNTLSIIMGFSELALHECPAGAVGQRLQECLGIVLGAAQDGARIVKRLREFNSPEEGESAVPVDLNALAEQAKQITEPRWKRAGEQAGNAIQVELDLQSIPAVLGSACELRDVLTNVIFNAVDAMPNGGTITLRTRSDNQRVSLEVSDTGTGMPEAVRERCLEPFFTTKGEGGTGLGLAMVYGTIHRHGGHVSIESEPGCGSTFRFCFPLANILDYPAMGGPLRNEGSLRVLVVHDQTILSNILAGYLAEDFHLPETALSATEAFAKIERVAYDLVIFDHDIPGMSAERFAQEIKRLRPGTPIIMLMAYGSSDHTQKSNFAALTKPVSHSALRQAIMTLVVNAQLAEPKKKSA